MSRHVSTTPLPLVRGDSRFRLRICFIGGGPRPFGWEVCDDEDGRSVRRSTDRFRTSSDAWEAGSAVLNDLDVNDR